MARSSTSRPTVIVFDVNETLLDLAPVHQQVAKALGGRSDLTELWFRTLLHYSLVHNATDSYSSFGDIAVAALQLTAARHVRPLDAARARVALATLQHLPPHRDVLVGLNRLRLAGYRLAALSNGSRAGLQAQLEYADLSRFFEAELSVEEVGKFKPDRRVYDWAAQRLEVEPSQVLLVAAHPWDLQGAHAAGWRTAFLERPGMAWYPLAAAPDFRASNLADLSSDLL
jgi:2-haloacid dehalogenase